LFGSVQTRLAVVTTLFSGITRRAGNDGLSHTYPTNGETTMKQIGNHLSAVLLAATLGTVIGCSSTPRDTGQYLEDTDVTTKVKAAIYNDPQVKDNEIHITTFKGVVQLSGFVNSQAAVDRAVLLTRGVSGVKGVTNDMRLK
jgi:hypothetical protein